MKIAIVIDSLDPDNPIQEALERTFAKPTVPGLVVTSDLDDADAIITTDSDKLLGYLEKGKQVIQLVILDESPAYNLAADPKFKHRFEFFVCTSRPRDGVQGLPALLPYLRSIVRTHDEKLAV
jgi:hypothetical protein